MSRLESSRLGRAALTVVIVLFLAAITTANVPAPRFRSTAHKVDDPVLAALGAKQSWSVFAPDPQIAVTQLVVRFTYRDGTTSTWPIRKRNPFTGSYRDYRWIKLAENAARSDAAGVGLLLWATRRHALPKPLAKAQLVRSIYAIAPPGRRQDDHPPPKREVLYELGAVD